MSLTTRFEFLVDGLRFLIGDLAADQWEETVLYYAIRCALARYEQVFERVTTQVIQLIQGGLFGIPLDLGEDDPLCEVVYLHWPAAASVEATTGQNQIKEWWYSSQGSASAQSICVDLVVEGPDLPAADDYILLTGVQRQRMDGLGVDYYESEPARGFQTVPLNHEWIILLGAAAYGLRSRECSIALKSSSEVITEGYYSPYHVGVLSDLANRYIQEFEVELQHLAEKRLHRPPWGITERRRLRRLME
jgi:hypothetical protein